MIIDGHTHIFPDKIAQKASDSIGDFYKLPMRYDGSVKTLLSIAQQNGIDMQLVHSVATVPEQVASINNFIADTVKSHPGQLIGFASLHPDMDEVEPEIERIMGLGLKGIKLHPDFQQFYIDERRMDRIYGAIEGKLPLLVHTGDYRFDYSSPSRVVPVLERFPALEMICAHFGGWSEWDEAERCLAGRKVWVDTCSSLAMIPPDKALKLIEGFGEDYVIFGSDYPMWDSGDELLLINRLGLSETVRDKLMYKNINRLLKLGLDAV